MLTFALDFLQFQKVVVDCESGSNSRNVNLCNYIYLYLVGRLSHRLLKETPVWFETRETASIADKPSAIRRSILAIRTKISNSIPPLISSLKKHPTYFDVECLRDFYLSNFETPYLFLMD